MDDQDAMLPTEAYEMALAELPEVWPRRLHALLAATPAAALWRGLVACDDAVVRRAQRVIERHASASAPVAGDDAGAAAEQGALDLEGVAAPRRGRGRAIDARALVARWCDVAATVDVAARWRAYGDAGVGVCGRNSASFPQCFVDDPAPPVVVFHRGALDLVAGARVAIVGTRTCTRYGRDVAFELGEALSTAGVSVVSGLALGIDAAAHHGALAGPTPPIAVVGSGIDVPYPALNARLWREVADRGCIISEAPLGHPPRAWRFPQRNRLIAALADVVVVVESHRHGGSLITADEAQRRGRAVLAVPGPVRSDASAGANALLADGCAPVCSADDVLAALGMSAGARRPAGERRAPPDALGAVVLDSLGWQPSSFDQLSGRTGLGLAVLAGSLDALERAGWIARRGAWFERVARDRAR